MCVCVCVCVNFMGLFGFVDLFGFVIVTLIYTFQQLSCDGERDALSCDIRKAY